MNVRNTEAANSHNLIVKKLIYENILNMEFILSVVIPVVIFSVFDHYKMTLTGTIAAGSWSIIVVSIQYVKTRKVNLYAAIGTILSAVGLIGSIVSKDPKFYLASPIVMDLMMAAVFFGSVLIGKPLILALAEYSMKNGFSEELKKKPKFKAAWVILTVAWGVLSITQALLRVVLLYSMSNEVYYAVSTTYGNISTPLLLLFSFWFPG